MDHRDLIKLYNLGHIEEHSPGLIHFHPHGAWVMHHLKNWLRKMYLAHDFEEVSSPMLLSQHLWEQSGHWEKYKDLMFVAPVEKSSYAVKPMSCPGQISIYKHHPHSYRELPKRFFEFGHVHRNESSGSLCGWMRLRGFVQDDAHVFVAPEQLSKVVGEFVGLVQKVYPCFGFDKWEWKISLRPDKRAGSDEVWDQAEQALRVACQEHGLSAIEVPGDGAFYGPKLEVVLHDRLGRQWQCGVAQVDFVLPERFELEYNSIDGARQPVLVHHAVLGSLERFMSIVLEDMEQLPSWLSPHQVAVLPISDQHAEYAHLLVKELKAQGLSAHVVQGDPLQGRVRHALEKKYVAIGVVGEKEVLGQQVSWRQAKGSIVLSKEDWIKEMVASCQAPHV